MAYVQPDADTLQTRFPAFAAVSDSVIEAALVRARRVVDDSWMADDRAEAEMLHAAHEMVMEGLGTNREAQLAGFKRLKLGSLELERDTGATTTGFNATTYGQRFRQILKRNKPGIMVITGS